MATKKTTKKSAKQAEPSVATKTAKRTSPKRNKAQAKKLGALDAAAKVLGEIKEAMACQELIEAMAQKGYWTSPGGKTPANTLSAALRREINVKGKDARFTLAERGKFALNGVK